MSAEKEAGGAKGGNSAQGVSYYQKFAATQKKGDLCPFVLRRPSQGLSNIK
jgi:hypothetical protein